MITDSKIKRLEKKFGTFIDAFSGWLFFENGLVSSDEKIVLKTNKGVNSILSHHWPQIN